MTGVSTRSRMFATVFFALLGSAPSVTAQAPPSQASILARQFDEAWKLEQRKDYVAAFALYQKGALAGHADSQNALGYMYDHGYGTARNPDKALEWWKRAAQQNNASAQYNIAMWYYRYQGGMEKNQKLVLEWLWKSAMQKHVPALLNLGTLLFNGWDDNLGRIQAVQLLQLAAMPGLDFPRERAEARRLLPQAMQNLKARGLLSDNALKPFDRNICEDQGPGLGPGEYRYYRRACTINECLRANPGHQQECEAAAP
jgi:TPR repeat protein